MILIKSRRAHVPIIIVMLMVPLASVGSAADPSAVDDLVGRVSCLNWLTDDICAIDPIAIARFDGNGGSDEATELLVSPDGLTIYVGGSSDDDDFMAYMDMATIAYDAETLEEKWAARYNGPIDSGDGLNAMGLSPDGSRIFVTGWSTGETCNPDIATVAYDTEDGSELWVARFDSSPTTECLFEWRDEAYALGVSPDGQTVFVAGFVEVEVAPPLTDRDFIVIAYDAHTGEQKWFAQHGGPTFINNYIRDLAVSPDGSRVFITGEHEGVGHYDFGTAAYDAATGEELWFVLHDGPGGGPDLPTSIDVGPSGAVIYVTGYTYAPASGAADYLTVAFNTDTGAELWSASYDATGGDDYSQWLAVSPEGQKVFVTGNSDGALSMDTATLAYDAFDGEQIWVARYDRMGGKDFAWTLALSPTDSQVFIAGMSNSPAVSTGGAQQSSGTRAFTLVAYEPQAGVQSWVAHYEGPGGHDDVARGLGVAPDGGTVYVTGRSIGLGTQWDYATVAYPATPAPLTLPSP